MFNFVYKNIDFAHKIDPASQPKENYSRHLHYFNEIIFFVKGDVKYTVENKTKNLEEGDIVLIPSLNYHFATVNSKTEYERYILKFPSEFLPSHLIDKMKSGGGGGRSPSLPRKRSIRQFSVSLKHIITAIFRMTTSTPYSCANS